MCRFVNEKKDCDRLLDLDQFLRLTFTVLQNIPAGIYLLKVNNRNSRTRCETCSNVSIANFEQINAGWEQTSDRNRIC